MDQRVSDQDVQMILASLEANLISARASARANAKERETIEELEKLVNEIRAALPR